MTKISRRNIIKVTGAAGASMLPFAKTAEGASTPAEMHQHRHNLPVSETVAEAAMVPPSAGTGDAHATYLYFNNEEAAFIEAAVARLIPKDEQWDGALDLMKRLTPAQMAQTLRGDFSAGLVLGILARNPGLVATGGKKFLDLILDRINRAAGNTAL